VSFHVKRKGGSKSIKISELRQFGRGCFARYEDTLRAITHKTLLTMNKEWSVSQYESALILCSM
jgi:hypothetical protein